MKSRGIVIDEETKIPQPSNAVHKARSGSGLQRTVIEDVWGATGEMYHIFKDLPSSYGNDVSMDF